MKQLNRLILGISRHGDIFLILLVIAIIGLMIIPLPTMMVDGLIATNLMLAVVTMMIAMYIPGALAFSVFPSLLLFTTLFRLALNITTTRLILLNADAGEIILTFGEFVVGGDFVVGAVVFLILTIVQFMVIAKGSERVAEVAARFTLDAMPGKQMSIDADLRAGIIDMDEARERRELVTKESQLYGAMDGAMKFVKGDAIAGLIVTAVNIVGGIAIGSLRRGMNIEEALTTYGILTIGDGLVSQIPALLISITAGIVVTRVTGADSIHLGGDISNQFFAQPRALQIGGLVLFLFAAIPGFPKPQFLILGTILGVIGFGLSRMRDQPAETEEEDRLADALAPAAGAEKPKSPGVEKEEFSITVPVLVDLSETTREGLRATDLNGEVVRARRALYFDLGVPFPGIHLRFREDLEADSYTFLLQEVPISKGWLPPGKILALEAAEHLRAMGFRFEEGIDFLPGHRTLWMDASLQPRLEKARLAYFTPPRILIHHLTFLLKKHAGDFLGIQETRYLLGKMESRYSELVKEVQRIMPLQRIAEIFRRLVQEQVSIRNLRGVLEALVEWGQKEKDSVLLVEYVRNTLKRQISYQYTGGDNILPVYMLDPSLEETIRGAIRQTSSGSYLALEPDASKSFLDNLKTEVGDLRGKGRPPVLLTSMDIRRYVRRLIEQEFYELPVVSYQELTEEVTVQPLGKVAAG